MKLTDFLLARITEDEQDTTRCADAYPPPWELSDRGWMAKVTADEPAFRVVTQIDQKYAPSAGGWLGDYIQHIARWDPARVLAECEAKRRIVELHNHDDRECFEMHRGVYPTDWPEGAAWGKVGGPWAHSSLEAQSGPCPTLRALALPHADHAEFDPSWVTT